MCRFFNDHFAPKSSHFYGPRGPSCDVYRLYNAGMGLAERQTMVNQGWTPEGNGIGVETCVPG